MKKLFAFALILALTLTCVSALAAPFGRSTSETKSITGKIGALTNNRENEHET